MYNLTDCAYLHPEQRTEHEGMVDFHAIYTGAGTSPSQDKKLFPIFRPKGERKTLYVIRHGESEFNAATNTGKGFSDPQIYDPKLTSKGQSQV